MHQYTVTKRQYCWTQAETHHHR